MTSVLLKHRIAKQYFNDDDDNNEKTKKLKHGRGGAGGGGYFMWEFPGWGFSGEGVFLGGV